MPLFQALLEEPDIQAGALQHPLAREVARPRDRARGATARCATRPCPRSPRACSCRPTPPASSRWPSRRDATSLPGRPAAARHPAARRAARPAPAGAQLSRRRLRDPRSTTTSPACVAACAERPETWINGQIGRLYRELHRLGHAHSVEFWQDGALAGGLYGVALGGAFFGESMFCRRRDASKFALIALVARLRRRRLPAARHPVRHRPPREPRRRSRSAAPPTIAARSAALDLPADFARARRRDAGRQSLPQLTTQTS